MTDLRYYEFVQILVEIARKNPHFSAGTQITLKKFDAETTRRLELTKLNERGK